MGKISREDGDAALAWCMGAKQRNAT
jgi:hypothetical protein